MNWSIGLTSTRIMLFASFLLHVFLGGSLDAETVFVTISLFNVISHPLSTELPHGVGLIGECFVTTKRIQDILTLPEKETIMSESSMTLMKGSVYFSNFYARWNSVSLLCYLLISLPVSFVPESLYFGYLFMTCTPSTHAFSFFFHIFSSSFYSYHIIIFFFSLYSSLLKRIASRI